MGDIKKEQAIKVTLKNLKGLPQWRALEELRKWGDKDLLALRDDIASPLDEFEVSKLAHQILKEREANK